MTKAFTLTLLLFTTIVAYAQPGIDWRSNFGGSQNDEGRLIMNTSDGGYCLIGRSSSSDGDLAVNQGDFDLWLMKVSSDGEVLWSKTLGGSAFDGGFNGMECSNGDFIVIGSTNSNDGDVSGNHGDSDIWVLRLDNEGNIIWQIVYGGTGTDFGLCIKQTADGGFIASGTSNSMDGDILGAHGDNDMVVLRISQNGDITWSKAIGGTGGDRGWHIIELEGGNFVLTGDSNSTDGDMPNANAGEQDVVAVFLNDDGIGSISNVFQYGGSAGDEARFVAQKPDGNLVFSGATLSGDGLVTNFHSGYDYWVFSTDLDGDFLWGNAFGGSANDYVRFMNMAPNGDVLTGGFSDSSDGDVLFSAGGSDAFLIRVNGDDGTLRWAFNYGGSGNDIPYGACNASDGGFVVSTASNSLDGDVYNALGANDCWVFKLENDGVSSIFEPAVAQLSFFPNPAQGRIFIKTELDDIEHFSLTALNGRTFVTPFSTANGTLELDISQYANGIYAIKAITKRQVMVGKVLIQNTNN
jgi:Secretion system C-terminal sorting domain